MTSAYRTGGYGVGHSSLSAGELRTIHDAKARGLTWPAIETVIERRCRDAYRRAAKNGALARALAGEDGATVAGEAAETADVVIAPAPPTWQETQTDAGTETVIESTASDRIRTLDDLLTACAVDLSVWTVDKFVVNKWETAAASNDGLGGMRVQELYQVKAWLSPAHALATATAVLDAMKADMIAHAPIYPQVRFTKPPATDRHTAVISMADNHFGMLSWPDETGEGYDVAIAEQIAAEAMGKILTRLQPYPLEQILLTISGDWFHTDRTIDGKGGTTTKGTMQETDGRWQRTWRIGVRVAVGLIDQAAVIAPVKLIMRPGNHDEQTAFFLGDLLDVWYRHNDMVEVANVPAPRCYEQYGVSMIGFAHGHNEKPSSLPMLMATEEPAMWAATTFHDWLTAHFHRKGILMNEDSGVQIYTMPSLCGRDAWHAAKGLMHRRSCEARVYHIDEGPIAHLTFNAVKDERAA